jgi:hypothetical protein
LLSAGDISCRLSGRRRIVEKRERQLLWSAHGFRAQDSRTLFHGGHLDSCIPPDSADGTIEEVGEMGKQKQIQEGHSEHWRRPAKNRTKLTLSMTESLKAEK